MTSQQWCRAEDERQGSSVWWHSCVRPEAVTRFKTSRRESGMCLTSSDDGVMSASSPAA
jgi:hypothetical protein